MALTRLAPIFRILQYTDVSGRNATDKGRVRSRRTFTPVRLPHSDANFDDAPRFPNPIRLLARLTTANDMRAVVGCEFSCRHKSVIPSVKKFMQCILFLQEARRRPAKGGALQVHQIQVICCGLSIRFHAWPTVFRVRPGRSKGRND